MPFETEFIMQALDNSNQSLELVRKLTGGQAIEAYQLLHQKYSLRGQDTNVLILQSVNPARLVERIQPRRVVRNQEVPEIGEASERGAGKEAYPGQYVPHHLANFVPLLPTPDGSRNDCSIITAGNILQLPYSEAKVTCFQYGWSSTKGLRRGFLELLCDNHNLIALYRKDLCNRPLDFFKESAPEGVFIVYVASHVMPCIHGKLLNLARTGWQTVQEVFEIQPRSVVEEGKS